MRINDSFVIELLKHNRKMTEEQIKNLLNSKKPKTSRYRTWP